MSYVNRITVCKSNYDTQEEFENAIKEVVVVLLNNKYIMTVRYDCNDKGLGIVVIDYDYANESISSYYPMWLSPEEANSVIYDNDK